MAYQDRYLEYLDSVPEIAERCFAVGGGPVLAYTSNLDVVVKWNADTFNELLDQYLKEEPSFTDEETIDDMEDFARIVSYFAIHGYGGEVEVTSKEVVEELKRLFEYRYELGGTCAQGSAALGAIGMPVLTHITDQSAEVIEWLDYKGMESTKDGKRVPIRECISGETPLLHLIVQYSKGDKIRVRGKEYEVALSNRIIIDYDQVHKIMPVRRDFLDYLEEHAEKISSYDISGFNAIREQEVLEGRIRELAEHYRIIKEKNPNIVIYFESAHYISSQIRDALYDGIGEYMDIMGMNEEELEDLTKRKAHPVDKEDIESVLNGLDYVLELYPAKGIVMHSKDYALYYGEPMATVDIEMGLTLGNLMSGTRARIGKYGTKEDCRKSLELGLSRIGLEFAERLSHIQRKHTAVLVPSRYMEKPRYTIGLGDTFVAGMQLCFAKSFLNTLS